MLDLLSDDLDKPELVGERLVPLEVIEALSFVMEGSLDNNKSDFIISMIFWNDCTV